MLRKSFFLIFCIFFVFFLKNIYAAPYKLSCPGMKVFNAWCAGEHMEGERKACMMVSRPSKEEGQYTKRGRTTITVYHLPTENSVGVFYVTAGYKYKNGSYVSAKIDGEKEYQLKLIEEDTAWFDEDEIEKQIIAEMKEGNKLKIVGFSSRGTKTTDSYSLMGFTAAYGHISQICDIKN